MKRRAFAVTAVTAAVFAASLGPAAAAWNSRGNGSGTTRAAQLQPPASPRVAVTSALAHVSWTAPSSGPVPGGYLVTRNGTMVCTTTGTACDDKNLAPSTTYSYLVTSTQGRYWVSPTPLTVTATTAPGAFAISAVTPSPVTAGVGLTFTVTAVFGAGPGSNDGAYTGAHPLTVTSSVPASPGGNASGGVVTPTFVAGVAKVATTVYGSGAQTLTVSDGARTGSVTITVSPAAPSTLELVNAAGTAVLCAPNGHVNIPAGGTLTAKVAVVDGYGNITPASGTLNLTLGMTGAGAISPTSLSIASATSLSTSTSTLTMPSGALKSGTLSISAQGASLSTRCSVN